MRTGPTAAPQPADHLRRDPPYDRPEISTYTLDLRSATTVRSGNAAATGAIYGQSEHGGPELAALPPDFPIRQGGGSWAYPMQSRSIIMP